MFVLERTVYPDDDLNVLVENLDASTLYTIGVVTVVDGFKGKPALATQRTSNHFNLLIPKIWGALLRPIQNMMG